jgi:hypothetical protein
MICRWHRIPNDDDDDEVNVDAFINTAYCDDLNDIE